MRINKINYEQYALDYLEGTLNGGLLAEMEAFLTQNPAIRKELEEMRLIILTPDEGVVYDDKEALRRPVGGGGRVLPLWWISGLAAVAAMLMVVWVFWGSIETTPYIQGAEVAEEILPPVQENKEAIIDNNSIETNPGNKTPEQQIEHESLPENKPQNTVTQQNMTQPESPAMLPNNPKSTTMPQETTTPKNPVARKPAPVQEPRPIAAQPQPQKPVVTPVPKASVSPDMSDTDWVDIAPIARNNGQVVVASVDEMEEKIVRLKTPSMKPPAPVEKSVASNTRSSKIRELGLLPERQSQGRFSGFRSAFIPEGFTNN